MRTYKEIEKYRARLHPLATPEEHNKEFGANLKRARKKAGLTQDDVAEIMEFGDRKTVYRYETGELPCPMEQLISFCELYECTLDEILPRDMLPYVSAVHGLDTAALEAMAAFARTGLGRGA